MADIAQNDSEKGAGAHGSACADGHEYCPLFQHAIELIGRRWTGSILKVLSRQELRFGEIRAAIPGLSDRLLDTRLTELEVEGIVLRSEANGEVRYRVTEKGMALEPVFASIASWVDTHAESMLHAQPGKRRC